VTYFSHDIGRQAALVLIDLVGIKASVEFGSLFRSELERLLIGGDTVPQILNELDSFFSRKMC
jgi:hypothetical protein